MECPKCGEPCDRDSVDVGVGVINGPWGCSSCGWSEYTEYDQTIGNGGLREDGGYVDPQGGYYPPGNPIAIAMREQANNYTDVDLLRKGGYYDEHTSNS